MLDWLQDLLFERGGSSIPEKGASIGPVENSGRIARALLVVDLSLINIRPRLKSETYALSSPRSQGGPT